MAIYKCKMCGGALDVHDNETVAVCEYCGSKQTVPTKSSEVITNLFNRANNLRLKNEFDKAAEIYGKILDEDDTNSEAHWCLLLCKYGIEYVEDPKTYKRIPTCHRAQYTSVLTDPDYTAAVANADAVSKEVYTEQAHEISELQKSILAIVKNEKPFDVFICYKESDENGKRTVDSALANDIYYQLTKEGIRVFYAAITLEDKLGQEYEPYIFAALNTAKVMLVIGTKPEYFEAVWVRNEWSRFLALMKTDRDKMLIPCYRDMDAYELPEEFSHLQAQDMSKIGFINDLVRGIKKVTQKDEPKPVKETVIQQVGSAGSVQALLKRGNLALEDHEWDRADGFFEEVLNLDAECTEAYLGKLLAKSKTSSFKSYCNDLYSRYFGEKTGVKSVNLTLEADAELLKEKAEKYTVQGYFKEKEVLARYKEIKVVYFNRTDDVTKKFNSLKSGFENNLYTKAKRFADDEFAKMLSDAENEVVEKAQKEFERITESDALALKSAKESFENKISAVDADNDKIHAEFFEKREKDYADCCGKLENSDDISELFMAASTLENMGDYKQSKEIRKQCKAKIERLEAEQKAREAEEAERKRIENEKKRKETNKKVAIACALFAVLAIIIIFVVNVVVPNVKYNKAIDLMENGEYTEAIVTFTELDGHKDSTDRITECNYLIATELAAEEKIEEAYEAFISLGDYKDSAAKVENLFSDFVAANAEIGDMILMGKCEQDGIESNGSEIIEWQVIDKKDGKLLIISKVSIGAVEYNDKKEDITWEKSSLRKYLNSDFINDVFADYEKKIISKTKVPAHKNPKYSSDPGADTKDRLFILSSLEAKKYFKSNEERKAGATQILVLKNKNIFSVDDGAPYWLRTPAVSQHSACAVYYDGAVLGEGDVYVENGKDDIYAFTVDTIFGLRPAMWIDISDVN